MSRLAKGILPVARAIWGYSASFKSRVLAGTERVPNRYVGTSWLFAREFSIHTERRSTTFNLAQPGEGILECEIIQWHVEVGQQIKEFDPLLEVQSDKANVEITSPYNGTIERLYGTCGEMIKVGGPLVDIQLDDQEPLPEQVNPATERDTSTAAIHCSSAPLSEALPDMVAATQDGHERDGVSGGRNAVLASPAVRSLARQKGIDLADVSGSGASGRVLKIDIERHHATGRPDASVSELTQPAKGGAAVAKTIIPLRSYRRAMVHAMAAATAIPHFHLCDDVPMDALIAMRDTLRANMHGLQLSLLPLLIKTLSLAITQHPEVNAKLSEDLTCLELIPNHNVGIAIATDKGLVVPCIRDVQKLSVYEIAAQLEDLKQKAHDAQLQPADLAGTSITLSNVGVIGGRYATPIVNTPQLAICALGRMRKGFVFTQDDQAQVASLMSISWGADHRALDGATLARFSNTWKRLMEDPVSMLLHTK